jgi:uracil-DNA glycosylase
MTARKPCVREGLAEADSPRHQQGIPPVTDDQLPSLPVCTTKSQPFLDRLRMTITTTQDYEAELRACNRCASEMCGRHVDPTCSADHVVPRPIVLQLRPKPFMLIGQAPGLTEYQQGKPFSGRAGTDLRRLFADCGCGPDDFDRLVHSSAVVSCFPGSKLVQKADRSRREDLKPSSSMIGNCSSFLWAQLEIVNPKVIILLGGTPLKAYIQWKTGKTGSAALGDWVGRVDEWQGRRVIPLAHTSGLSTWLHSPENMALQSKAKDLLAGEFTSTRRTVSLHVK